MIASAVILVAIALGVGLVGVGLGILLSRPLSRLADRALADDAEPEEVDPGDGRG